MTPRSKEAMQLGESRAQNKAKKRKAKQSKEKKSKAKRQKGLVPAAWDLNKEADKASLVPLQAVPVAEGAKRREEKRKEGEREKKERRKEKKPVEASGG